MTERSRSNRSAGMNACGDSISSVAYAEAQHRSQTGIRAKPTPDAERRADVLVCGVLLQAVCEGDKDKGDVVLKRHQQRHGEITEDWWVPEFAAAC